MVKVELKKHSHHYTEVMSELMSDNRLQEVLKLNWQQVSLYGTRDYIEFIQGEERMGEKVSRVIFNEHNELIGVITLKNFDQERRSAHMGTWLGADYWGKGYNELAKEEMLKLAFNELHLIRVFAGAAITNKRSLAAQKKLPYMRINVSHEYPEALRLIEKETKETCILNVVEREEFFQYMNDKYQFNYN